METFNLDSFRSTGLPLDWMTLYIGWAELSFSSDDIRVRDEAVQAFAANALSTCSAEDEDSLFRIADDTSIERKDIKHYLSTFAAKSGISEAIARRKWRFVYLSSWLDELSKRAAHIASLPKNAQPIIWDEFMETVWEIDSQIQEWNLSPEPPKLYEGTSAEATEKLNRLRDWLAQEKAELMGVPTATTDGLPISVPPAQ